jgi:hypothetical protein
VSDQQYLAAQVVMFLGIAALTLLVLLNAGGLALAIAVEASRITGIWFLFGTAFALAAILAAYLLGQAAAADEDAFGVLSPSTILWVQLAPALGSALIFMLGAIRALQTLS